MPLKTNKDIERFLRVYEENNCKVYLTCKKTRTSTRTFYEVLKKNSEFAQLIDDANERYLDSIEIALHNNAVERKDTTALIYILKKKGKHRGWGDDPIAQNNEQLVNLSKLFKQMMEATYGS